ncbi:MAG: LuxR C-terminal-related transcriptional regulator [Rhodoferax sp.]
MDRFNSLLLEMYRAAREVPLADFQDVVLNRLSSVVPFDSAKWGSSVAHGGGVVFHDPHVQNESPEAQQHYAEVHSQDAAARYAITHFGQTANYSLPGYYAGQDSAAIRGYVRRWRHEQALITAFNSPATGLIRSLSLYGAYANRPFTECQRRIVQAVVPHLFEALAVNRSQHLDRWSSADPQRLWSLSITDSAGYFLVKDAQFEALLEREWPQSDRAAAPPPLLRAIGGNRQAKFKGHSILVVGCRNKNLQFLKARALQAVDDLTPQQIQVAQRVAQGLTHKEIAKALGIAPSTTRNHLQAILARTSLHNNAELAAQLKSAGYC